MLNIVGHSMDLISTKDDIFRFTYHGLIRHIIGIRAYVKFLILKLYPECKDVKLESENVMDESRDIGHDFYMQTDIWNEHGRVP